MFAEDQKITQAIALASPEGLGQVMKLALLSAQVPFENMPRIMAEVNAGNLQGIQNLTAVKRDGLTWIDSNQGHLHKKLTKWWIHKPDFQAPQALLSVMNCPGLGMVKGGFVLQMTLGTGGCLDTHNLRRFGLKRTVTRSGRWNSLSRWKWALEYLALCERLGGAEALWDGWCRYVADYNPGTWDCPEAVSSMHWRAIDEKPF